MRIFFFADRRFERDRFLRDLDDLAHLFRREAHLVGDLFDRRIAAELLQQLARDLDQPVDRFDHVHRDADRARLVGQRAGDRLADPPRGVGRELVALAIVEFLDGADQAEIAFLNEVEEEHAAADVLLRDRNDQAQVGFGELAFGFFAAEHDGVVGRAVLERFDSRRLRSPSPALLFVHRKSGTRPISLRYMRTGSSSDETGRNRRRPLPRPRPRASLPCCSSTISMPSGGNLFEKLVDAFGRDVFDVVEHGVDFFIRQRAALLAALEQFLLKLFERDRRRRFGRCVPPFLRAMFFAHPLSTIAASPFRWAAWGHPFVRRRVSFVLLAQFRPNRLTGFETGHSSVRRARETAAARRRGAKPLDHPLEIRAPGLRVGVTVRRSFGRGAPDPSSNVETLTDHRLNSPKTSAGCPRAIGCFYDPLVNPPVRIVPEPGCVDPLAILDAKRRFSEQRCSPLPVRTRTVRATFARGGSRPPRPRIEARSLRCWRGIGYSEGRPR